MTCYTNCIYCEVCDIADDMEYEDAEIMKSDCPHFKNKADFVEVVKCKNCRNYKADIIVEGVGWCEELERGFSADCFCSYGERKVE